MAPCYSISGVSSGLVDIIYVPFKDILYTGYTNYELSFNVSLNYMEGIEY